MDACTFKGGVKFSKNFLREVAHKGRGGGGGGGGLRSIYRGAADTLEDTMTGPVLMYPTDIYSVRSQHGNVTSLC